MLNYAKICCPTVHVGVCLILPAQAQAATQPTQLSLKKAGKQRNEAKVKPAASRKRRAPAPVLDAEDPRLI